MTATSFQVLIVGAGIAGLTTAICCLDKGFNVTLLESGKEFSHVGAGLMLSSNATKVLCDMGLRDVMEACGSHMKRVVFLSHDKGKILDDKSFEDAEQKLGAPIWQVHRADLHECLLVKARSMGASIIMDAKVESYDGSRPTATLADGRTMEADVIVAADGYRSYARGSMMGKHFEPRFSGNSAYRGVIPRSAMLGDAELEALLDPAKQTNYVWVGAGRHALAYPIRKGEVLNVVTTQPAVQTAGPKYVVKADPAEIVEMYAGWDPLLIKIFQRLPADGVLEWKLCDLEPLDSWIFPGQKIVLIGDAAHAMLPSAAQGAGMGIEDGAAFAELLARARSQADIPACLDAFQRLRLPRCTEVVDTGRQNVKKWHATEEVKGGTVTDAIWDYDVKTAARNAEITAS